MRLLQIIMQDTELIVEDASEITLSFGELVLKGGWVMVPIILLSLIAIYIFVERFYVIARAGHEDMNFMDRIKDYIYDGKIDAAVALCKSSKSPASRMVEKGLSRIGRPLNDVSAAIENLGKLEIYKLEKGLPTLATVAGAAPMIGFLGTVIGMIKKILQKDLLVLY